MVEWKPISELFDFEKGTLQSSKCRAGTFAFVTAAEEWKTHESFTHDCEALIFAMAASGSLGRTHYVNGKFIASDLCFILTPRKGIKLDLMFYFRLFNFLRSNIVKTTSTGTSKLAINQTNFGAYRIPYFDFEHQLLFRDKIEIINEISQNFDAGLNDQLALFKQLRQAILQEAIEGKLTADWRKEHPDLISGENHASKLLEKIIAEKERLINEGKIKKDKSLLPITKEDKTFALPDGWMWARLGEICSHITDIDHNMPKQVANGVKFLSAKDLLDNGTMNFTENIKHIAKCDFDRLSRRIVPRRNDIIYSRIGARLGKARIVESDELFLVSYSCCTIRTLNPSIVYISSLLDSGFTLKQAAKHTTKNSIPDLGIEKIKNFLIPFPSLAEQNAIVERIEKFMAMIDIQEKQVTERKHQSEMLMHSVLLEAFSLSDIC